MQIHIGKSNKSNAAEAMTEALNGVTSSSFILVQSPYDLLEGVAEFLKDKFPGVPNLGTAGTTYFDSQASDKELVAIAFGNDAKVATGVLRGLSVAPLKDLADLEDAMAKVGPGAEDSVCIEYCTNDEEVTVTSMNVALETRNVQLVGGTVFGTPEGKTSYVMVDSVLYPDACGYVILKNTSGKIRTYSENIYKTEPGAKTHIATKVNLHTKELIVLDGRPAADVYSEDTGLSRDEIVGNVLKQPLGRVVGDKCYISSMYAIGQGGSLVNYKRLNENDTVSVLKLMDYKEINSETFDTIRSNSTKISMIFSVNCIYRHLLFTNEGYLNTFIGDMNSIAPHVGYVGGGEQYKKQHVNQTMVCAVFE